MTGEEKFNTCKWRSETSGPQMVQITACCSDIVDAGYLCYKKSARNITPAFCASCLKYEKKDEPIIEQEPEIIEEVAVKTVAKKTVKKSRKN